MLAPFGFASSVICISALSGLTLRIFQAQGPSPHSFKEGLDFWVSSSVVAKLEVHNLIDGVWILGISVAQPGFLFQYVNYLGVLTPSICLCKSEEGFAF